MTRERERERETLLCFFNIQAFVYVGVCVFGIFLDAHQLCVFVFANVFQCWYVHVCMFLFVCTTGVCASVCVFQIV